MVSCLIKSLMKRIKNAVTRGVTALPLKRNLVLRFVKEVGYKKQ
jgi:hypothetical protein